MFFPIEGKIPKGKENTTPPPPPKKKKKKNDFIENNS